MANDPAKHPVHSPQDTPVDLQVRRQLPASVASGLILLDYSWIIGRIRRLNLRIWQQQETTHNSKQFTKRARLSVPILVICLIIVPQVLDSQETDLLNEQCATDMLLAMANDLTTRNQPDVQVTSIIIPSACTRVY